MRNGLIGLASAVVLASTMATAGCGSSTGGGGTGGTGGSSSSGGVVGTGGSSSSGGQAGGGASGGVSVTNLSGTKALNALTAAEATKLCDDTYAYFGSAIPQSTACKWKALSYATSSSPPTQDKLRSNCTSKETGCQAADPSAVWPNPGCGDLPSTCTATVAEYSACIRDEVTEFNQTVNGLPSCTEFTSAGTSAIWDAMGANAPADCTSLTDKCPDLYPPTLLM